MASSTSFQSGYQYSNIPNVDDPLSVSVNGSSPASTMTSNSGQPRQQQQNLPPELQPPSSMSQNQQQQQPRVYNPTYHEYPQNNAWNNVAGSGMDAPAWLISSGHYTDKRNRFMIGAVVIIFLFMVTHVNHHHNEHKASSTIGTTDSINHHVVNNGNKKDNSFNNNEHSNAPPTTNKGVAGGNPVPIPSVSEYNNKPDDNTITNSHHLTNKGVPSFDEYNNKPDDNTITNSHPVANQSPPTLTYLLTYPMSGTTYTVQLIEATTGTNTATNHDSFFVRSNDDHHTTALTSETNIATKLYDGINLTSPFWHNIQLPFPTKHVLCQTHCGTVKGLSEVISANNFDHQCRTVHSKDENTTAVTPRKHWDSKKRIIHLVRDPFSNVVSRFHAWRWEQMVLKGGKRSFSFHTAVDEDKNMFREKYCKEVDEMDVSGFLDKDDIELRLLLQKIPCALEFMKYVIWHTLANRMKKESGSMKFGASSDDSSGVSSIKSKSLTIYYEDFGNKGKTDAVVAIMADFLGYDTVDYNQRPNFAAGIMYTNYFTEAEREAVEQLVRIMLAHDDGTWNLLKGYF